MNASTLPKNQLKKNVPDLRTGQVIRIHERIQEGSKERVQVFEGLVIAVKHGKGLDGTFTVRKTGAGGIGVERIFPVHMPAIEKIEVLRQEKVRRSKLYFVRNQVGKKTKKRKTTLQSSIYDMAGNDEVEEPGDAEDLSSDLPAEASAQAGASAKEEAVTEEAPETEEATDKEETEGSEDTKTEEVDGEEEKSESADSKEGSETEKAEEELKQEDKKDGEEEK